MAVRLWSLAVVLAACGGGTKGADDDAGPSGYIEPAHLTISVDRTSGVIADGQDAALLHVTVHDDVGTPIAGVEIEVTGSDHVLIDGASTTNASGESSFALTSFVVGTKLLEIGVAAYGLTASATVEFEPGAAARLVFLTAPTTTLARAMLAPVQVGFTDAFGNPVTVGTGPIRLELVTNSGGAQFFGAVVQTPVLGVATFSEIGVALPAPGLVARASAPSVMSVDSAPFDVIAGPQLICTPMLPGQPSMYVGQPTSAMFDSDFNGDGHRDVAIAEQSRLTILRGIGDGTFLPPVRYGLGSNSGGWSITGDDFDGDGDIDIALGTRFGSTIQIFVNQGDASFIAAPVLATPTNPLAIIAADVDGNATSDLVVRTNHSVHVYAGSGSGTFQLATSVSLGVPMYSASSAGIALGRIDGDARLDILTDDSLGYYTVLLGTPNGGFQALQPVYTAHNALGGVALADFNGDGNTDAAVGLKLLVGNGDGTFAPYTTVGSGFRDAFGIRAADLNADGKQDLVALTSGSGLYAAEVYLGNGNATFTPPKTAVLNKLGRAIAVADFDGDGTLDVASVHDFGSTTSSTFSVHRGRGDGSLVGGEFFGALVGSGRASFWEVAGDFDGDGTLDLVAENHVTKDTGVQLRASDGALTPMPGTYLGGSTSAVARDLDNDGKLDLLALGPPGVRWLRGNGDGTLQAPVDSTLAPGWAVALRVGRLDAGPTEDVVAVFPLANAIVIAFGAGDGTWTNPVQYAVGSSPADVQLADFDGDSDLDIVVSNRQGASISVLCNNGAGAFGAAATYSMFGLPSSISIVDLDGDANADVLVANESQNHISFFRGRGDCTFDPEHKINVGTPTFWVGTMDLDGDGVLDVLAKYDALLAFRALGNLTYAPALIYGPSAARKPVLGDFDGDGAIDFMLPPSDQADPGFTLLRNGGCH